MTQGDMNAGALLSPATRSAWKRFSCKGWLPQAAGIALAATWFWAATSKWGVPKAVELFGVIRDVFPWLPARWAERFALGLPVVELVLGGGLVLPRTRRWAALGSLLLLSGFTVFLLKAWAMGYQESCGCFGESSHLTAAEARWIYGLSVLRNCGLLILATLAFRRKPARGGPAEAPLSSLPRHR